MADEVGDVEKGKIAANFLLHSPPGESTEVWQDLKVLLDDEQIVRSKLLPALIKYNKDQLTPVSVENSKLRCLVTQYNDLGGGRFADHRTQQSFKFDHLKREATDFQELTLPDDVLALTKPLDDEISKYVEDQFQRGSSSIFGKKSPDTGDIELTICIEAHHFKSKNFQNGRWRSIWSCTVPSGGLAGEKTVSWTGKIKVQVHHFDDGNVQLLSTKSLELACPGGREAGFAADVARKIQEAETAYQEGLKGVFFNMSGHVKGFRRPLPVFGEKIPWERLTSLKIGESLQHLQDENN
ncbi:hypothetical protein BOX15_Mlig007833g1 [Macrostomum lignano]|uniref:F-actin-capping protein subunit alpha n=2 Tax=Macrostomum lignano TaxID=282301 RepID=A0A1I8HJ05_9PLAT|nr:hypothetical protein BOX15_Mlig026524g1 [Macrostomum lignano]PAA83386.1 hypothetical protein BOX15_Mlig026524g2 [Macrostomum lignano]PAA87854.1 hypothetical protein BOX15_Mlig007833g1 [Macrostomum lignano]